MTRVEFGALVKNHSISPSLFHFENSVADGYYILQNHHRWEVFFRERGKDYDCVGFPSESDALKYLLSKLISPNQRCDITPQSEVPETKTLRVLRITSTLNCIFCFFCIASTVCFALSRYLGLRLFFDIANAFLFGWIINPIGIVSFIVCLVPFLKERKDIDAKLIIGKKWVWIFVWPVITTILYLTSVVLTVAFTGGV